MTKDLNVKVQIDSSSSSSINIFNNINKELVNKINYIFNTPPNSYCANYSSIANTIANSNDDYPIRDLFEAANTSIAVCPITNFAISTPFKPMAWAKRLAATRYPYPAAAVTLVKCLRLGVDIGFLGNRDRIQVGPNLESANEHPVAIDTNIATELDNGRRKGPFNGIPFDNIFYSNPLGVVFKKGKTNKPRVIHHLSWPRTSAKSSVNASILDFDVKLDAF